MEDLASYVVKLGEAEPLTHLACELQDQYRRIAPGRFCAARLRWYIALQHLLAASRAFVFQVTHWERDIERRLDQALALLARATEISL